MPGNNVKKRKAKKQIIIKKDASSDSEDYSGVTFQRQALEIRQPPEGFDPHRAPQDGEHYLMQMAYERKHIPAIVVKRPRKLKDEPTALLDEPKDEPIAVPPFGLPTEQWKDIQVQDFQELRSKIVRQRSLLATETNDQNLRLPLIKDQWLEFCQQHPPALSIIMRISQRTLEQLLEILAESLRQMTYGPDNDEGNEEDEGDDDAPDASGKVDADNAPTIETALSTPVSASAGDGELPVPDLMVDDKWLGQWLYGVLACLQMPLEGHVHFSLRHIARLCVKQRERLQHSETDEQKAIPYNLLICLIAHVFDQLDMKAFV